MCLGIPGKIIEIYETAGLRMGKHEMTPRDAHEVKTEPANQRPEIRKCDIAQRAAGQAPEELPAVQSFFPVFSPFVSIRGNSGSPCVSVNVSGSGIR